MGAAEGPRGLARRAVTLGALAGLAAAVAALARTSGSDGALGYPGDGSAGSSDAVNHAGGSSDAVNSDAVSSDGGSSDGGSQGSVLRGDDPPLVSRAGLRPGAVAGPGAANTGTPEPAGSPSAPSAAVIAAELPRGGRTLFPRYRLVGYSGGPGSAAFGRLGVGDLDARVREIESLCSRYTTAGTPLGRESVGAAGSVREGLPVLELIAVVVQRVPGDDGRYRVRVDPTVVDSYLAAARRHRALLLLDIQPGRAGFLDEVRAFERWLLEPDVGIALDPEWAVQAPVVPGEFFGHVTGVQLDAVSSYLADLVARAGLPEKAMVVHQLSPSVIRELGGLRRRAGVVVIKSIDGIGTPEQKSGTWRELAADVPAGVRLGFKLFFSEDTASGSALMTPAQVLALTPTPDYVLYE